MLNQAVFITGEYQRVKFVALFPTAAHHGAAGCTIVFPLATQCCGCMIVCQPHYGVAGCMRITINLIWAQLRLTYRTATWGR